MGSVPVGAGEEDAMEPALGGGELMTTAVFVEEGEAVDAHEDVDADFFVGEVALEDGAGVEVE